MAYYRCYFLSRSNSFTAVNEVFSETDSDAIVQASLLAAKSPHAAGFELWQGARQVCKHVSSPMRRPAAGAGAVEPVSAADCAAATERLLSARHAARSAVPPLTLAEARRIRAGAAAIGAAAGSVRRNG